MKKLFFLSILASALLLTGGCSISFNGSGNTANDGGVYFSNNKGEVWQKKALIPTTSGAPRSISGLDASTLEIDPQDNKAIYFGSYENGLFYSYNQANEWMTAAPLKQITINDVAVDHESKCTIYAAIGNRLMKSSDCNRTWSQVYYDNDINVSVNTIASDHFNSGVVYIGTSRGEIIKSSDRGLSWQTIGRFKNSIGEIAIDPNDSRIIFVASYSAGVFRTKDSGANWINLEENLKNFKKSNRFKDLVLSVSNPGTIYLANGYGLLKSIDYGDSWSNINLITPETKAIINSLVVNPNNPKEIYYVTNTTFYRSTDGGENWATKKLPTTRAGWKLLLDPTDSNIIYMGVKKLK
jgi:photosystem II stability/assembly factor-like uncharacterized protein